MSAVPSSRNRRRLRAVALLATLAALAAGLTAAKGSSSRVPLNGAPDQAAADVLHVAALQLGDPYAWGGNGPDAWDCSGLTSLWRTVGGAKGMPRVSRDQQRWAVPIPKEQALKGDLVFFGEPVTHVGIVAGGGWMIDAGASRKSVVRRQIWSSGTVRYGRVPRPSMPKVTPWTPPAGTTTAQPAKPATAPVVSPGVRPLAGLPARQAGLSSKVALKAANNAQTVLGSRAWNDISLVRTAWRHAGGAVLPEDRAAIAARGRRVALADARVGDLVVYGRPDIPHLGLYLGNGYMVDASKTFGRVVVRKVYAAPSVRLVRLG